jgi:hypothetical protein
MLPTPHLYIHIAKTAGTSLAHAVKRHWGDDNVAHQWVIPDEAQALRCASKPVIFGHLPYGFHQWFEGSEEWTYATFLRDPVQRVASLYRYHRSNTADPNHHFAASMTLAQWLEELSFGQDGMTAYVSGAIPGAWYNANDPVLQREHLGEQWYSPIRREQFVRAESNLERNIGFIGLTERYEDSLVLMEAMLGVRYYPSKRNVTQKHGRLPNDVPDADRQLIRSFNRWDIQLYQQAQELFERQVDAFGGERELQRAKSSLRKRALSVGVPVVDKIKERVKRFRQRWGIK